VILALTILLVLVCLGLAASVLLQSPRGAGLTGSFGSGGGAEQIFGKRRGVDTFLSRLTVGLAIAFFLLATLIAYLQRLPGVK